MLVRRQQRFVQRRFRQAALAADGVVLRHAPAQFRGIGQLVVAVGHLHAMHNELETLGDVADHAGQRGLTRGIVRHEHAPVRQRGERPGNAQVQFVVFGGDELRFR